MSVWRIVVANGLLVVAGCSAGGYRFEPDASPPAEWADREGRILRDVRQLTSPAMGLDKSGEAYFSPDGQMIIFQAHPHGEIEYQMYTLRLDEQYRSIPATLHRVSPPGGACTCGYFRPDGHKIIFGSTYLNPNATGPERYRGARSGYQWPMQAGMDIFECNLDGSEMRRLTDTPGYDAECGYSPDGRQIAFTSYRADSDPEIFVMDADGSHARRITHARGYDGGPFFSPDGKRIIFRGDRRGDSLLQLYVVNAEGTGERRLTDTSFVNWGPYWHPNGRTIVFATSAHGHENYEVYLMNIDTGRTQRVTYHMGFDGLPVFSADGRRLMWTSKRGPDNTSQVFLADFTLPEGF